LAARRARGVIDVLVIGGIFREVTAFDEAPKQRFGGSGLTAATAARSLGAAVALAGAVGSEDAAEVRALLDGHGIASHLSVTAGRSGTFAHPTHESADRPWPLYRPAEGPVIGRPKLPAARVLVLFGVPDFDPIADGWADSASRGAVVLWDRQGWLSRAQDDAHVLALDAASLIYVANQSEAAHDARADEAWALDHQPPPGYAAALIKRGAAGVLVYHADGAGRSEVPAFAVDARSTIGSGDAFAGAVAAAIASGLELLDAVRTGCAVSAALVERGHNLVDRETIRRARALLNTR
jgi:ribokinase